MASSPDAPYAYISYPALFIRYLTQKLQLVFESETAMPPMPTDLSPEKNSHAAPAFTTFTANTGRIAFFTVTELLCLLTAERAEL